jgi:hypothetical protein
MRGRRVVFLPVLLCLTLIQGLLDSAQPAGAWFQAGCGTGGVPSETHVDLGMPLGGPAKPGSMPSNSSFSQPVLLWSLPAQDTVEFHPFSDPVFGEGSIWLVSGPHRLMALDPLTGEPLLDYDEGPQIILGPVLTSDSLIMGYRDGTV